MPKVTLIDSNHLSLIINRLCYQLIENHNTFADAVIIGLQPRGIFFAEKVVQKLQEIAPHLDIKFGKADPTFYRDDFRRSDKTLLASGTDIPFSVEGKNVILIDDVLYTGRTIRSGMECLLEYGRPKSIELMVLIDRRLSRELPIEPKYIGSGIDSFDNQKVRVIWSEESGDKVLLLTESES